MYESPIDIKPLVNIMNNYVDEVMNSDGLTFDQATVLVVQQSLLALAASLVETVFEQENPHEITVSTNFIHGLMATVEWLGDRLELSKIPS